MCDLSFDDPVEYRQEVQRRARFAHVCDACDGPIRSGDLYFVESWKLAGTWESERCCLECRAALAVFTVHHDGMRPVPGYFAECLRGCLSDGDPETERNWRPVLDALEARGRGQERSAP